jgi:mediator of RNA polymerase II transcription subunit 31
MSRANPWYLNFLATQKLLEDPTFVSYLEYLQYFSNPKYAKFLMYAALSLYA